ncbi:MAG TPA: ribosome maturation factor RimM, partial [Yinghuangia sp.]|nr:ribosome maturation factor RimM [Yinghuangia sp.]
LLIVRRPDGGEVMVPFVAEIVPEIDLDEQRLVVTPPPGLIDAEGAEVASARDKDADDRGDTAP